MEESKRSLPTPQEVVDRKKQSLHERLDIARVHFREYLFNINPFEVHKIYASQTEWLTEDMIPAFVSELKRDNWSAVEWNHVNYGKGIKFRGREH